MPKRKYRILIVDDDDFILTTLKLGFEETPYEVITVNNPITAYELIENEPFSIVICDIVMPEMDGITLLGKIKKFNGMIQVIMLTQEITVNNTIKAFRKGAIDIFFKPLEDMDGIMKAVDDAVEKLIRVDSILKRASR